MSKRLPLIFLLTAILLVLLTLSFAQDVPFHAEVIPQTARMRWGPGTTFAVQHYANAGHVLLVLEVDADSDEPWTWYYARTPSGVQSWIRSDLVRRSDAVPMEQRVSNPTGIYPVRENNLCNTDLFRACQQGTDFQLWEAGYWAKDRYDTWERDGRNLNVVFYLNPCRTDSARVCTTREQWDAGLTETVNLALTLTPEATFTPIVIQQTVVSEIVVDVDTFTGADAALLLGQAGTGAANLYTPPRGLYPAAGTRWGEFRLNSESIRVDCYFWHNAFGENVKSGRFGVNLGLLRTRTVNEETRPNADDITNSQVNCVSGNIEETQVVARQWKITITRSYSGRNQISGISWRLEATYGQEPTSATSTTCGPAPGGTCVDEMNIDNTPLYDYVRSVLPTPTPEGSARVPRTISGPITAGTCELTTRTTGEAPREIVRYEHTCETTSGDLQHTLTFRYTRDETRGFAPQPTPNG